MTASEQTMNVTVAQVEDALLKGQTVPDFAREWSEPPANVLAIFRRLQREGRLPVNGPAQIATRTLSSVPTTSSNSVTAVTAGAPTVDTLAAAAARSTSKRTQALGKKLHDLAGVLRQRLNEEREQAERAEKDKAERQAAAAEVSRLEAALAEARANAGLAKRRTTTRLQGTRTGRPISDEQRAAMLAGQRNETPCAKGCGFVGKTKSGKAAHERNCGGAA